MDNGRTRYREFTPWSGVIQAIVWGVVIFGCYSVLAGWDGDLDPMMRLPVVALIIGLVAVIMWVLGGLTVLVQESRIVMHLGRAPFIRRSVPFDEIIALRSVEYRPLREFGGWGVRGLGKRKAWSARGNQAVALKLTDDRELLIGSDHPKRLEERIRMHAGITRHD